MTDISSPAATLIQTMYENALAITARRGSLCDATELPGVHLAAIDPVRVTSVWADRGTNCYLIATLAAS